MRIREKYKMERKECCRGKSNGAHALIEVAASVSIGKKGKKIKKDKRDDEWKNDEL